MEECPNFSETTLGLTSLESSGVAEIVEPNLGQARLLKERLEGAVPEV